MKVQNALFQRIICVKNAPSQLTYEHVHHFLQKNIGFFCAAIINVS